MVALGHRKKDRILEQVAGLAGDTARAEVLMLSVQREFGKARVEVLTSILQGDLLYEE